MRNYGQITPQFWIGSTGRRLRGSPDAQLLALYLITCPAAQMTGIYYCPIETMVLETGMPLRRARQALAKLFEERFALFDPEESMVFVRRMLAHQLGPTKENDNRIESAKKMLLSTRCRDEWKAEALQELDRVSKGLPSPPEGLLARARDQEQDQDQEQEKETTTPPASRLVDPSFQQFWTAYPRKAAKGKAEDSWKKIHPDEALTQKILASVDAHKKCDQWVKDAGQFIPHPATWLNQRRWEDETKPEIHKPCPTLYGSYEGQPPLFWLDLYHGRRQFADEAQRERLQRCKDARPEWFAPQNEPRETR